VLLFISFFKIIVTCFVFLSSCQDSLHIWYSTKNVTGQEFSRRKNVILWKVRIRNEASSSFLYLFPWHTEVFFLSKQRSKRTSFLNLCDSLPWMQTFVVFKNWPLQDLFCHSRMMMQWNNFLIMNSTFIYRLVSFFSVWHFYSFHFYVFSLHFDLLGAFAILALFWLLRCSGTSFSGT
jgi:hypothetical protein